VIKQRDELDKLQEKSTEYNKINDQMNEMQKMFERVFPSISKDFEPKKQKQ